jgi:hypothetical protein
MNDGMIFYIIGTELKVRLVDFRVILELFWSNLVISHRQSGH